GLAHPRVVERAAEDRRQTGADDRDRPVAAGKPADRDEAALDRDALAVGGRDDLLEADRGEARELLRAELEAVAAALRGAAGVLAALPRLAPRIARRAGRGGERAAELIHEARGLIGEAREEPATGPAADRREGILDLAGGAARDGDPLVQPRAELG